MKNEKNKKTKIIIGTIITLIILIIVVLAILYFFTDTFKTKKEIFSNNLIAFFGQNEKSENKIEEYINRKATSSHKNTGNLSTTIDMPESEEIVEAVNNMNITFEGSIIPNQNQAEQNINIVYSDGVEFPINYLRDNDIYGLQNEYISSKYIAVENNNLKEFFGKLGLTNLEEMPDKIEFSENKEEISFTEEEKTSIKQKYLPLLDVITDEKITVQKTDSGKIYTLNTTTQEIKDLITQFLEILKDDEIILNKINSILEQYETTIEAEKIEEIIQSIQEQEIEEQEVTFSITVQNRNPIQIKIQSQGLEVTLNKDVQENNASYSLDIMSQDLENEESQTGLNFSVQYNGLESDNVTETYNLNFGLLQNGETISYDYNIENQITFTDDIQIENLTEDNAMILNEYSQEQISNLMTAVTSRIVEVNQDQMQQLGVNQNPLLLSTPISYLGYLVYSQAQNTIESTNMQNLEIESFNNIFLKYEGKVSGTLVKSLIQAIDSQNASGYYTQISGDITDISQADEIKNNSYYNVSFQYDSEGRISGVIIEEVLE